jgi:hypothetical protein
MMHGRSILAVALFALACARPGPPQDLVSAALAARGDPLPRFSRDSELRVYEGFEGAWRWQLAFAVPERLRMVLKTTAEDQVTTSDGARVKSYLGNALVTDEPAEGSGIPSLARFTALVNLDVLADATRVRWHELEPQDRPPGSARALRASFTAHPESPVRLGFDADLRLAFADGEVAIPGLGSGVLEARFSDYRRVGGRWLPLQIRYRFRGAPLLDERVVEWRPDDALAER